MESKEISRNLKKMILKQQWNNSYIYNVKTNLKSVAKTSLDILKEMPNNIEMLEIAASADFALLLMESLEDATSHINEKLRLIHLKRMNEQTKTERYGNNDSTTEGAGEN